MIVPLLALPAAGVDVCATLERELANRMTPFLASGNGRFYFGGASLAGNSDSPVWPVSENETLGFTHPFLRDGRARGEGIVCESITGCGHSLWGWNFYRQTRVLYGSVSVGHVNVTTPAPTSIRWRPDRFTATYHVLNATLEETKFFTSDGVLVDIINVTHSPPGMPLPVLHFAGHSYVNTNRLPLDDPATRGIPHDAQVSVARTAKVELLPSFGPCGGGIGASNAGCIAIGVHESGTAYAKPLDCAAQPQPPGYDCQAKVGKMMYDNTTAVLGMSVDISATVKLSTDKANRQWYNFSVPLTMGSPLVLTWAHGDDPAATAAQAEGLSSVDAALAALAARTEELNSFLTAAVPYLNVTQRKQPNASITTATTTTTAAAEATAAGASGAGRSSSRTIANRKNGESSYDVYKSHSCGGESIKIGFLTQIDDESGCEAGCSKIGPCLMWEYDHAGHWCALFNGTSVPQPSSSKFDCGCRGACPDAPGPAPPPPPADPWGINDVYWYGWANFFFLSLMSGLDGTFETIRHAQSAPNNFLGLHLHDSQFYIGTGAWLRPDLHSAWAHGNILMWARARDSPMLTGVPGRNDYGDKFWKASLADGLMPDNMGSTWVSSFPCDQLSQLIDGTWTLYLKGGGNQSFLRSAYSLFRSTLAPADGNISDTRPSAQRVNWYGGGKRITSLAQMRLMALALGLHEEAAAWEVVYNYSAPYFTKQWGLCGTRWSCEDDINAFAALWAPDPLFRDEWAHATAEDWLLNAEYGYYAPNRTWGAVPLASPLNDTHDGPWLSHTTGAAEVMEGLFRHDDDANAVNLTLAHIAAMQRDYGFSVYPEAWDRRGGLWGDQWYLWGVPVGIRLVLERLAGVLLDRTTTHPSAKAPGVLTLHEHAPDDWEAAHVRVPEASGAWIDIRIDAPDAAHRTIRVSNNTMGALLLEPWLNGRTLVSASPAGYKVVKGHVCWTFVGAAARNAEVQIVTAAPAARRKPVFPTKLSPVEMMMSSSSVE